MGRHVEGSGARRGPAKGRRPERSPAGSKINPDAKKRRDYSDRLLGDDTDTVAAMAGSLVGAFAGVGAIPPALLEKLEDGPAKGRTHIASLAAKLFAQTRRTV